MAKYILTDAQKRAVVDYEWLTDRERYVFERFYRQGIAIEDVAAEEYMRMYSETGDKDYLTMAHDETTHAEKFIRAMPEGEKMREYMARHNQIAERIKKYGAVI